MFSQAHVAPEFIGGSFTGAVPVRRDVIEIMLTELIASITARFSSGRAHPLTHTWSTTRWIEQNARLDADERMQELLAQINAFNASPRINAASLSAFLVLDVSAHRCIRELTETYLAGNRAANKAVLKKLVIYAQSQNPQGART